LIDAADRSGKVLTIGHELRLSSQWKKLKDIIDEGEIGKPMYALVSIFRFPFRKELMTGVTTETWSAPGYWKN